MARILVVDEDDGRMLARRDEAPAPLRVRGEPDPVAVMSADVLQVQRRGEQRLAQRD